MPFHPSRPVVGPGQQQSPRYSLTAYRSQGYLGTRRVHLANHSHGAGSKISAVSYASSRRTGSAFTSGRTQRVRAAVSIHARAGVGSWLAAPWPRESSSAAGDRSP